MDLQSNLKFSCWMYVISKPLQLIYQTFYVTWLIKINNFHRFYIFLGCFVLGLNFLSHFFLYNSRKRLFAENGNNAGYSKLALVDLLTLLIFLIGYPTAALYASQFKNDDNRGLYHVDNIEDSLGLEVDETNENPQYLIDENINEQIENITMTLVGKAVDLRGGLISLMNIEENFSGLIDTPQTENNEVKTPTAIFDPKVHIISFCLLFILSFIFQISVVAFYLWIENVKSRIRAAPQPPPPIEMVYQNGGAAHLH